MNDQISNPTSGEPKKNNTTMIIIIVVVVLLCCCCIAVAGLWQYGDQILKAMGQ
jgi:flagellar basal body-associated protein FliL